MESAADASDSHVCVMRKTLSLMKTDTIILTVSHVHVCVLAVWTGWLLRLACDTHLREEFETLHQAVLELVKVSR
jgi:hypothetical protein